MESSVGKVPGVSTDGGREAGPHLSRGTLSTWWGAEARHPAIPLAKVTCDTRAALGPLGQGPPQLRQLLPLLPLTFHSTSVQASKSLQG